MDALTDEALRTARLLFERGATGGTTGNISVRENELVSISASGSCFGTLASGQLAQTDMAGNALRGRASKELPLHLALYRCNPSWRCVIHTHGPFATLFSCLSDPEKQLDALFRHTPYLAMKTNRNVAIVPYAAPGSAELFAAFEARCRADTPLYLLRNHGAVAAGANALEAFSLLEELEAAARLAHQIHRWDAGLFSTIE